MFDPQRGYPSVVPYVRYRDPTAGIEWLTRVAGAREVVRMTLADGRVGHAELRLGASGISVGLASAAQVSAAPADRSAVRAMTLVFVADVDEATVRAEQLGGAVVDAPADMPWGLRQSVVTDPEGHVWELSTHLRDVSAADWGAEQIGPWFGE